MAAESTQTSTGSYELSAPGASGPQARPDRAPEAALSEPMLIRNVGWFCRLRWVVVAALGAFGLLTLWEPFLHRMGLLTPGPWPLLAASVLTAGNALFLLDARRLKARELPGRAHANLWTQILLDLAVLTAVVHFCGGGRSYVPFTYLFHIVLACVFLPRVESLAVLLVAAAMYAGAIALVQAGLLPPARLFVETPRPVAWRIFWLDYAAILGIWTVVWYLAADLSGMVRRREDELAQANRRLLAAQAERSRHMLATTHQLKAPFAAIHASTQLLLQGYTGALPEEAVAIVERIAARSRRLANEIHEMLQLANLSSTGQKPPPLVRMDLGDLIAWAVMQVGPIAANQSITIETELVTAWLWSVEDHLKMVFANLLSNAVAYSRPGGRVWVKCGPGEPGPWASVADEGIGIPAAKLPRIFDEYYRTKEAVQHNRESSGLGLAIVREVAQMHGIGVRVESAPGVGTTFTLRFPPVGRGEQAPAQTSKGEVHDGLRTDC
ncbi:MAG: HAMP domain-containing sensor histidine kinase [Planctomycetota bacterium]|nr:HAMP domain-containing sensor histidine kinase [Planctomycetota bacterium]